MVLLNKESTYEAYMYRMNAFYRTDDRSDNLNELFIFKMTYLYRPIQQKNMVASMFVFLTD